MDKEFDEDEAVRFMQDNANTSMRYGEEQMLNIIDIVWDYYEDNGLLDIDSDEELDIEDLVDTAKRLIAKDKKSGIKPEDIEPLVMAELAYEESLEE